jgi:hypothetical protein
VADELYFGMPQSEHSRLAPLEDAPGAEMAAAMPPDLPMFKGGPATLFPTAALGSRSDILSADIPARDKTSARAIAGMYASLLGEVDAVRLITPELLREVTLVSTSGIGEVFGMPSTWGLGSALGLPSGLAGSRESESRPTLRGIGDYEDWLTPRPPESSSCRRR